MIIFHYREEKGSKGKIICRPVADIELKSKTNEWVERHPYIDSGADVTLAEKSEGIDGIKCFEMRVASPELINK